MRLTNRIRADWTCGFLLGITLATACSKLNQANYDKVQVGMSQQEAEAILGPGKEQSSSSVDMPGVSISHTGGTYVNGTYVQGIDMTPKTNLVAVKLLSWQDGGKIITLTFENDRIIAKAQSGL